MKQFKNITLLSLIALGITACNLSSKDVGPIYNLEDEANSTFPYHPFVYHLDLSILAYQLYGQTLVWPFDPYYEEHDAKGSDRQRVMDRVHQWSQIKGSEQIANQSGLSAYRGPGALIGLPNNPSHDPIIYEYSRIYPWSDTLTNAAGTWTEYLTPKKITGRIKDTYARFHNAGTAKGAVSFQKVISKPNGGVGKDVLLAFEGGTGDKGETGQPASQSLMGLILVREKPADDYDLHIAFRGSRSGSAGRAVLEALSDSKAKGNPDWITDLGYNRLSAGQGTGHISTIGKIHRGFAKSMESIHPNLFHCLNRADALKNGQAPTNIYVTGHSLGGALAQAFVSSVLLGNQYGPDGTGASMPSALRDWPWKQIKLVSYSAPRIGDSAFAQTLTEKKLQSEFFSTLISPVDSEALKPNDRAAFRRLLDASRPAAFRVLHSKDPITTEKGAGGKHVGKSVYVNVPSPADLVSPPDFNSHEQYVLRDAMRKNIDDPAIPRWGMRYRTMQDINPSRNSKAKGSLSEIRKLAEAVKNYYKSRKVWFDYKAFDQAFAERLIVEKDQ